MEVRQYSHLEDAKHYTTERLRKEFLIEKVMEPGAIHGVYSMIDRIVTLGVVPTSAPITLPAFEARTRASYFLERRELGVINIGGTGTVKVDGEVYELANKDCLYVGRGKKEIIFTSADPANPAEFYINSCPAHKEYPTAKASQAEANPVHLGSPESSNQRTIFQFIHENGIKSCQLVMGFTELKPGSVWNTFPPHTHDRRMEVYFYFDMPQDRLVMHFMGEPTETRHIVMRNKQAVISPSWSIHSGAGTGAYTFIWGMCGENQEFVDMDHADMTKFM